MQDGYDATAHEVGQIKESQPESERVPIPFLIRFVKFFGWFLFFFGLVGAITACRYFQVVMFDPELIVDPFGMIVVLMFALIALMGFPIIKIFAYIAEGVCRIRYAVEKGNQSRD